MTLLVSSCYKTSQHIFLLQGSGIILEDGVGRTVRAGGCEWPWWNCFLNPTVQFRIWTDTGMTACIGVSIFKIRLDVWEGRGNELFPRVTKSQRVPWQTTLSTEFTLVNLMPVICIIFIRTNLQSLYPKNCVLTLSSYGSCVILTSIPNGRFQKTHPHVFPYFL